LVEAEAWVSPWAPTLFSVSAEVKAGQERLELPSCTLVAGAAAAEIVDTAGSAYAAAENVGAAVVEEECAERSASR
jgi:hypothetical protein